eukprot:7689484-Karenia_brevis.AAC.1
MSDDAAQTMVSFPTGHDVFFVPCPVVSRASDVVICKLLTRSVIDEAYLTCALRRTTFAMRLFHRNKKDAELKVSVEQRLARDGQRYAEQGFIEHDGVLDGP